MKRAAVVVAVLVLVQAALYLAYRQFGAVEKVRFTALDEPAPALAYTTPDGTAGALSSTGDRPVLLHFWATWCPPCREELPSILALAEDGDFDVLAVTVDEDWATVRSFLGGDVPAPVVRAPGEVVERDFGVRTLPSTFVVRRGRLRARFDGAREWGDAAVVEAARSAVR